MTTFQYPEPLPFRFEKHSVGTPEMGIRLYKSVLPPASMIPERLEKNLASSSHPYFRWHDSLVGEGVKMPEYRDCVDFKYDKNYDDKTPPEFRDIIDVYYTVADVQNECLRDYQSEYNINMTYMEAINFVKYTAGQHFNVHTDHGFSYVCTVSSVMYLNESYEGGELWFPKLDIKIKPEYGDVVFFPSTYIYAHASMPVTSGVKYSAVTMYDYNDDTHKFGGFTRQFGQTNNQPYEPSMSNSITIGPITPTEDASI